MINIRILQICCFITFDTLIMHPVDFYYYATLKKLYFSPFFFYFFFLIYCYSVYINNVDMNPSDEH